MLTAALVAALAGAPALSPASAAQPLGQPPRIEATQGALDAFRRACPALLARPDASGLTTPADWQPACADAEPDPATFFARHFAPVRLGDGTGLATGYFEAEAPAARTATPGSVPILARPPELVDADLGRFSDALAGQRIAGLLQGQTLVPAPDRAAIEAGAFAGRGLEIAWAPDPVAFFFLQIQGSGTLRFPGGQKLRIGYAGRNGHPYVAIGRLLRDRGELTEVSMETIKGWLRAHPADGRALMRENPSWIFFRVLPATDSGPTGALGVPLAPRVNVAADPATLPLGAPVWIETTVAGAPFKTLAIAADTGSAIRGANRFDIFFGAGADAERRAGPLQSPLKAVILLPKSAVARLAGEE